MLWKVVTYVYTNGCRPVIPCPIFIQRLTSKCHLNEPTASFFSAHHAENAHLNKGKGSWPATTYSVPGPVGGSHLSVTADQVCRASLLPVDSVPTKPHRTANIYRSEYSQAR